MKVHKSEDPAIRAIINDYVQYSATTLNYSIYKRLTDITDDIITGAIYNQQVVLQSHEIEDYCQFMQIKIFEKVVKEHQYKTIDNLVSYIFILAKNRLIDFLRNYNVRKKTSYAAEKAQHMFNRNELQFQDYIYTFNPYDEEE